MSVQLCVFITQVSQSIINKNLLLSLAFPGPIAAAWGGCTGADTTQHRQPSSVGKEQMHGSSAGGERHFIVACMLFIPSFGFKGHKWGIWVGTEKLKKHYNKLTKPGLSTALFVVCHHYTHKLEEKLSCAFVLPEPGTEGTLMVRTCLFSPHRTQHTLGCPNSQPAERA